MEFHSTKSIKDNFNIDSNDIDVIYDTVYQIRLKLHPDKTNGEFMSEVEKENYYNADAAIKYLNLARSNSQIIVVEKMTEMIKAIAELSPINKENILQTKFDTNLSLAIKNYKSIFFIPKLSLTGISAFMTFLIAFPKNDAITQYFPFYINTMRSAWFPSVIITCVLWIISYFIQEKAKNRLSMLKVDSIQNKLFSDFLSFLNDNLSATKNEVIFSKDAFTYFVYNPEKRINKNAFVRLTDIPVSLFNSAMTLEVAQSIAEIILSRYEAKGGIEKTTNPKDPLSESFKILF